MCKSWRSHLDDRTLKEAELKDRLKEISQDDKGKTQFSSGGSNSKEFNSMAEKYRTDKIPQTGLILPVVARAGHALLQMGLFRLAVKLFPGVAGWFSPVVNVAYERVRKNTDLPALVEDATDKLKDVQHERAQQKLNPRKNISDNEP